MDKLPLTSLASLLALAVFFWTLVLVARARTKYAVVAPAVTGNPQFERCFRVQMNTIEQLVFMFPALWLAAFWVGDLFAAACALVWCIGRVVYGLTYIADPAKRSVGFFLTVTPSFVMWGAAWFTIIKSLMPS
jgi:glutathione S-transferase